MTRPVDLPYEWATDPGARVEPPTSLKESGFVPGVPVGAGVMNDLLGRLSDWATYLSATSVPVLQQRVMGAAAGAAAIEAARTTIDTDTDIDAVTVCPYSVGLLVGMAEGTTPRIEVRQFRLGSRGINTAVVVDTGTAVGDAGLFLLKIAAAHLYFYHTGDSLKVRTSADDGATWSAEDAIWDPTVVDPGDVLYQHVYALQLVSGRIVVACGYRTVAAPTITESRYIYSDDSGATWVTNGDAGFTIIASGGDVRRAVLAQDNAGYVWTIGQMSNGIAYQRSIDATSPLPAAPATPSTLSSSTLYGTVLPIGLVYDGGAFLLISRPPFDTATLQSILLVPTAAVLAWKLRNRHAPAFPTAVEAIPGGVCRGNDGGVYVALADADPAPDESHIYEFDLVRQPAPE